MKIAIPKEITDGEMRVAATPETVKKMAKAGFEVLIEKGAGEHAAFHDGEYVSAGGTIVEDTVKLYQSADILFKVRKPADNKALKKHEISLIKENAYLFALLQPLTDLKTVSLLAEKKIRSISMEMVPRIARAQKLDALSSQSNVAGYKAVLMAANLTGKMMPMLMTAAGTVAAARVLVLGAGVAGLQAIATARRLGAIVEAFDVRPVVKDQVESLGAKFLQIEIEEPAEDSGGYAKEVSEDTHKKELELIAKHARIADIIITTALIPGKKAPILITKSIVEDMRPGSVIMDLAAEGGGNCELTEAGKTVSKNGVTIMGETNFPSLMAHQASVFYAKNMMNLLLDHSKDGKFEPSHEDEIIQGALITENGEVVHPVLKEKLEKEGGRLMENLIAAFFIFFLAVFTGFELIQKVPPTLHTPLMSGANAISGITLVGAIICSGPKNNEISTILGLIAIIFATVNVVGGFMVTDRMLKMFKRKK